MPFERCPSPSPLPRGRFELFDALPARSCGGIALVVRVVVAVAVSLGSLLFASELFFARAASRELVQQDARSYVADAGVLETAYREGSCLLYTSPSPRDRS